jgi:hypothetical protein
VIYLGARSPESRLGVNAEVLKRASHQRRGRGPLGARS